MSLKKNFGYNLILTFCNYLIPILVYPYVSRVLGVSNIGICNYVDSIINYFVLFSMLGVTVLGVREIARYSDDTERRSQVFSTFIVITSVLTILAVGILIALTLFLPKFQPYRPFLWIGVAKLVSNTFLIEWFFRGIQNFKYITSCSVSIRLLYVVSIFLLVKTADDTLIYYLLTTLTFVVNALVNWFYSRRFIHFSLHGLMVKAYILPVLVYGYYMVLSSLYTTFNTFFLGLTCGDEQVGYFSTATKLNTIIMSIFTAFTSVMVPRVAQLLQEGKREELQSMADKTFSMLTLVAMPIILLCEFCAPHIITLIAGPGYEGAILPFRIVSILILIIGMEQIVIQQFLLASRNNRAVAIISTVGAVIGLTLNFCLTHQLLSVGSSIAWATSEVGTLLVGIHFMRRIVGIRIDLRGIVLSVAAAALYLLPLLLIAYTIQNLWTSLILSTLCIVLLFPTVSLRIMRNPLLQDMKKEVMEKLKRGKEENEKSN